MTKEKEMPDLLDGVKADLDKRIAEIEPLVAELDRLKQARAALGDGGSVMRRARRSRTASKRRPRASMDERKTRTLALIDGNKGITTANLASLMDLTYLTATATVRKLVSDKTIKKSRSGGWETRAASK